MDDEWASEPAPARRLRGDEVRAASSLIVRSLSQYAETQHSQLVRPDEDGLVQLRVWIRDQGLVEIIVNEVGRPGPDHRPNRKDAWKAAPAVMRRQGYENDM